jgi:hypothetical protein
MAMKAPPGFAFKMNPRTKKYELVPTQSMVLPSAGAAPGTPGSSLTPSKPVDPYKWITRNGQRVLVRTSQMTPAERAALGAAPVSPAADPAAKPRPDAPTWDQFANYQDPDYFIGLNNLRNEQGLVGMPGPDGMLGTADDILQHQGAQSKLATLNQRIDPTTFKPVSMGGETLYDVLYQRQQATDTRNLLANGDQAGKMGLMRSGWRDQQLSDLAGQSAGAMDQLVRQYGTDLNDSRSAAYQASQEQADAIQRYTQGQGGLAAGATGRGWQAAVDNYKSMYGGY